MANDRPARWLMLEHVLCDPGLSVGARYLFALLAVKFADPEGVCWPGVETLASSSGYRPRQIKSYLRELKENGYLKVEKRRQRKTAILKLAFEVQNNALQNVRGAIYCPSKSLEVQNSVSLKCKIRYSKTGLPLTATRLPGDGTAPIEQTHITTNVGSKQVASAKGKVPSSRCEGVVVNPIGGNAKGISANEKLRKNGGGKCSGPGQPVTGSTSRKRNKEGDSRVAAMFEYFRQTLPTAVIDYGKHGRLLKTRFAALDSQQHQPEESLTLMKRLWDTYLQLKDDWQVRQDGHTLDGFLQSRTFSKVWSLARKQTGTGTEAKVTGGLSRILRE